MGPTPLSRSKLLGDSIKVAANNGESNISIGWKVLLGWSHRDVWSEFLNPNRQVILRDTLKTRGIRFSQLAQKEGDAY